MQSKIMKTLDRKVIIKLFNVYNDYSAILTINNVH